MSGGVAYVLDLRPELRQPRAGRPRRRCATSDETRRCATCSSGTASGPTRRRRTAARRLGRRAASRFTLVLPRDYQRVLDVRAEAETEGLDPDGARGVGADHGGVPWLTPRASCTTRERELPHAAPGAGPHHGLEGGLRGAGGRRSCSARPAAAWTAASRSATTAARSATSSPSGTTSRGGATGARRSSACTRRTTSRSSPAGSARRRARPPACSASTSRPVTIKQVEVTIDRPGLRRRARCTPQPPERLSGKTVAVVGSGPGRPRRRPAADPRRPHRRRLRARRPARRPAALRHPRVQDGEGRPRPPAGPDGGRGHPVPHRRRRRRRHHRPAAARPLRRGRARHRRDRAARPAGARAASSTASTRRWSSCRRPTGRRSASSVDGPDHSPTGKDVVIIGGGDTGADCLGTAHRQGAALGDQPRDHAAARPRSAPTASRGRPTR